jgi:cytochrome c-type protein NapC
MLRPSFALLRRFWAVLRRPSAHFSLGFLTIGGFIAGIRASSSGAASTPRWK